MTTPGVPRISYETRRFNAGKTEIPPLPYTLLVMHLGDPIRVTCRRDGRTHRGTEIYGDLDLIPSGVSGSWEISAPATSMIVRVPQSVLSDLALAAQLDPNKLSLNSRFGIRDPQLHHIMMALKSEGDAGWPGGSVFADSLGTALATRLLRLGEYSQARELSQVTGLERKRVERIRDYIEENLGDGLSLAGIAAVGGTSVSTLKSVFRRATGQPVHQYVIQRRVVLAERLLKESAMSITEVAMTAGFAHHSHLVRHLRRWRGTTPSAIRGKLRERGDDGADHIE
jgi:AraC family transcriptional regulator